MQPKNTLGIPDITKEYKYVNIALLLVLIAILLTPFAIETQNGNISNDSLKVSLPYCFVKEHTGRECYTCGLTRSIVSLYNGDFNLSVKYHESGYLFVAVLFFELLLRIVPVVFFSKIVPWLDIGQVVVVAVLFRAFI